MEKIIRLNRKQANRWGVPPGTEVVSSMFLGRYALWLRWRDNDRPVGGHLKLTLVQRCITGVDS